MPASPTRRQGTGRARPRKARSNSLRMDPLHSQRSASSVMPATSTEEHQGESDHRAPVQRIAAGHKGLRAAELAGQRLPGLDPRAATRAPRRPLVVLATDHQEAPRWSRRAPGRVRAAGPLRGPATPAAGSPPDGLGRGQAQAARRAPLARRHAAQGVVGQGHDGRQDHDRQQHARRSGGCRRTAAPKERAAGRPGVAAAARPADRRPPTAHRPAARW